jgi:hypothetical protein
MFYCFISFGYLPGSPLQQRGRNDIADPLGVQPSAQADFTNSMTHRIQKIVLDVLRVFKFNHVICSDVAELSSGFR